MSTCSMAMCDEWSTTHVSAGFVYYWLSRMLVTDQRVPLVAIVVSLAAIFEIVENCESHVHQHRAVTSRDAYVQLHKGDTRLNIIGDIMFVALAASWAEIVQRAGSLPCSFYGSVVWCLITDSLMWAQFRDCSTALWLRVIGVDVALPQHNGTQFHILLNLMWLLYGMVMLGCLYYLCHPQRADNGFVMGFVTTTKPLEPTCIKLVCMLTSVLWAQLCVVTLIITL